MFVPRFSRRRLLASVAPGAAALAAPVLRRLAHAAPDASRPKRLITFFVPHGFEPYKPTDTGATTFSLPAPLEPFRNDTLLIEGVDLKFTPIKDIHNVQMMNTLTGRLNEKQLAPNGPSIDQVLADAWNVQTRFKTLELGVVCLPPGGTSNPRNVVLSYSKTASPIYPDGNPFSAFDRIFAGLQPAGGSQAPDPADVAEVGRLRARRKSVLDAIRGDLEAINRQIGAEDKRKFAAHLEAIGGLEKRLLEASETIPVATGKSCGRPAMGAQVPIGDAANIPALGRMQIDNLVMAMACDRTRIGQLQWLYTTSELPHPFVNSVARFHGGVVHKRAVPRLQMEHRRILDWYAAQLAYLLTRLKEIPDGTGTLLDQTLILFTTDSTHGEHGMNDGRHFILGRAGGSVRPGRILRSGRSHAEMLAGILRALGVTPGGPNQPPGTPTWGGTPLDLG